jgi:glycosyltransferase involved in cell wall biosynthesis
MADLVTVTTDELANRITQKPVDVRPERIRIVPNGWGDSKWFDLRVPTKTINIGWGGTITHRSDFLLCRDALIEIALKYEHVKIVIAGDPEIYGMMKRVSEAQKMFLPMVRYEDYPHTLTYYDILLAPLEDTPFNNAKSDIKLVDAGAAIIPFVASDMPVYSTGLWDDGGYLVNTKDEWFSALEELVTHDEIREAKGKKCREIAMVRHIDNLSKDWLAVYKEAL